MKAICFPQGSDIALESRRQEIWLYMQESELYLKKVNLFGARSSVTTEKLPTENRLCIFNHFCLKEDNRIIKQIKTWKWQVSLRAKIALRIREQNLDKFESWCEALVLEFVQLRMTSCYNM